MMDNNNVIHGQNGVDHVSEEIGDVNKVLAAVKKNLDTSSHPSVAKKCCICRVHEELRRINEQAYTPKAVAIGPYHRDKPNLQPMQEYKLQYVKAIVARTDMPETKLEEYINALRELEQSARECYSEPINLKSDDFIQMMLVDGLFIIELLRRFVGEVSVDAEDGIFEINCILYNLRNDLILIENQIPMFVLRTLFDLTMVHSEGGGSLLELALQFFNPLMPRDFIMVYNDYESNHLLDLLGNSFDASFRATEPKIIPEKYIPSVTKLQQAGIKLKKGMTDCFLNIKFSNGVLEIPPLYIGDSMDSFLRNMIASEQYCYWRDTCFTSYAVLMDDLINSADDVELLCHHGIIRNGLGSNEVVSTLFNKLCLEVNSKGFYYAELYEEVNAYCNTCWNGFMATLRRDYFSTPLKILSIIFATFFSIITVVGTIFSILSFAIPKS